MLELTKADWKSWKDTKQTLAVFAFEGDVPDLLGLGVTEATKKLKSVAKEDGFKGKERETLLCRPAEQNPVERVLLIGLGKKSEFNLDVLRRAASKAIRGGEA